MLFAPIFHAWERRIHAATPDRVVRPFEWGFEWAGLDDRTAGDRPLAYFADTVAGIMADTAAFYATTPAPSAELDAHGVVRFDSALRTPHAENNVVHARYFPSADRTRRAAVVVLPQWNSDGDGHVGLSRLLARFGMSALRLSLPYHDLRMPPELSRADYIVSANVGRTLQVCRQAVLDARRAVMWLAERGYERVGILGTSLGSCLSMLTAAHEPLVRAAALNHVSPFFADVVWDGLSTQHVRAGLEGRITLDDLAAAVAADQPAARISRACDARPRCSSTPGTISPSRSASRSASSPISARWTCRTRSSCCRAATTAPVCRRSSGWTATCSRSSCTGC